MSVGILWWAGVGEGVGLAAGVAAVVSLSGADVDLQLSHVWYQGCSSGIWKKVNHMKFVHQNSDVYDVIPSQPPFGFPPLEFQNIYNFLIT